MSLRNGQIIAILVCLPRRELLPLASAIRPFLKLIRIYYPEKFIKRLENWLSIVLRYFSTKSIQMPEEYIRVCFSYHIEINKTTTHSFSLSIYLLNDTFTRFKHWAYRNYRNIADKEAEKYRLQNDIFRTSGIRVTKFKIDC